MMHVSFGLEGYLKKSALLKSEFKTCTCKHDFVTSELFWQPAVIQYATYTSVMLRMDFNLHLVCNS